jgi:hypothetical protein
MFLGVLGVTEVSRVAEIDQGHSESSPPSSGRCRNGWDGARGAGDGIEGVETSGEGGGPANEGIASIFALESPGKYLSSKSARSEILVSLVVGL